MLLSKWMHVSSEYAETGTTLDYLGGHGLLHQMLRDLNVGNA